MCECVVLILVLLICACISCTLLNFNKQNAYMQVMCICVGWGCYVDV